MRVFRESSSRYHQMATYGPLPRGQEVWDSGGATHQ